MDTKFQVADYDDAVRLDSLSKNSLWMDATGLEMGQIDDYDVFKDNRSVEPSATHKKIRVHLDYDVKRDGRHKAPLMTDGHLTNVPVDRVYSGVVSLRGIHILPFLSELNDLQLWATDIGNAYLRPRLRVTT